MDFPEIENSVFNVHSEHSFNETALRIFHFQYARNIVYQSFVNNLNINIERITHYTQIPFLPIEFFKNHSVYCGYSDPEIWFHSSGTTGTQTSRHPVARLNLYEESFKQGFKKFYGSPTDYTILALLPSYLERENSSLIFMVQKLIDDGNNPGSGFYLHHNEDLISKITASNKPVLLLGVSFALLDLAKETKRLPATNNLIVMETGGMKGRRREMIREELHHELISGFKVETIHSEYGMTELLSQAYSKGEGKFQTPNWMKVLIRDTNDPLTFLPTGKTGALNIIDLANVYSCSFIATQDLGRLNQDGSFEVLGRFDNSDVRGCNLMVV